MTRIPGEPLGALMQRLDGTCFSHSGIAVHPDGSVDRPATHLASALARDLPGDRRLDLGGVRWDRFGDFWEKHRELYCIPMPDHLRHRALGYLAAFEPVAGREGRFSVVKLVTVAAALRSVELQDIDPELAERLFEAAHEVASAWVASPRTPSYYCAELVAHAYGRRFTRAEMTPPQVEGYGLGDDIDEPGWVAWLTSTLADETNGIEDRRARAWAELFAVLLGDDWDFLHHAAAAVVGSPAALLGDVTGEAAVPTPLTAPRRLRDLEDPDAPLPHALVTPRMLWSAFGPELRRVESQLPPVAAGA